MLFFFAVPDEMTEDEGRELAAMPKWGAPESEWRQDRPNTLTNSFGVLDEEGQTIPGVHVELSAFRSPRLGIGKYTFTLRRVAFRKPERAYQLEITCHKGLNPADHRYSHEHYGESRYTADATWANASYQQAVERFVRICNLTLTDELPDPEGFRLT